MPRKRDGECPEHGDHCPYIAPAGTTNEKPLPRIGASALAGPWPDPDLIRGIERVTGETYDPDTDTWKVRPRGTD
jgi:hypothetical protein